MLQTVCFVICLDDRAASILQWFVLEDVNEDFSCLPISFSRPFPWGKSCHSTDQYCYLAEEGIVGILDSSISYHSFFFPLTDLCIFMYKLRCQAACCGTPMLLRSGSAYILLIHHRYSNHTSVVGGGGGSFCKESYNAIVSGDFVLFAMGFALGCIHRRAAYWSQTEHLIVVKLFRC